jgi:hypothetical protein
MVPPINHPAQVSVCRAFGVRFEVDTEVEQ